MKTIQKYTLSAEKWQDLELPVGTTKDHVLSVKGEYGKVAMWLMVDTLAARNVQSVLILRTGEELILSGKYLLNNFIGTVVVGKEELHLFLFKYSSPSKYDYE